SVHLSRPEGARGQGAPMAKAKKKATSRRGPPAGNKAPRKAAAKPPATKRTRVKGAPLAASRTTGGPVTLAEARALAQAQAPARAASMAIAPGKRAATHASVAEERQRLEDQVQAENERRIREYKATMSIMKARGVKGLTPAAAPMGVAAAPAAAAG